MVSKKVYQPTESLLNQINSPEDLRKLDREALPFLCKEIREMLIEVVSKNGGHLSSNLGIVEATVALHYVFQSPEDKILWDVGHQAYVHKILTGRREQFSTIRQENGLSGFPKQKESPHDAFVAGHSSNSISAALGIAKAARLSGKEQHTVAVIGDGALTGGEAYEGLNNAGRSKERLCVILNDNEVSISKNVGAISKHLANIRTKPHYFRAKDRIEGLFDRLGAVGRPFKRLIVSVKKMVKDSLYDSNLFENFGFVYLGPVDGHDCNSLIDVFQRAKSLNRPVLIHMHTTKGKGYSFAEENPGAYHGAPSFDAEKGGLDIISEDCFSCVFGKELARLATEDPAICAVTAAMKYGTGLQYFRDGIRDRLFDVGIAEQHAVTFSAGLAAQGMKPVFAVYSTFLQRAYDQVLEDCAIENNKVVLAVDRAGIVGEDGETHQGIFDVSFLSAIPGITIFSPSSYQELKDDLFTALYRTDGLVAIRYPRGKESAELAVFDAAFAPFRVIGEESPSVLLATYGRITAQAILAVEALKSHGVCAAVLQLNQIHPIPDEAILEALKAGKVFFFEEGIAKGSVAEHFGGRLLQAGFSGTYRFRAIDNQFVPHAPAKNALHHLGLDAEGMISFVNQFI